MIAQAKDYLNKNVKIKIDRPLGSKHPKHDFTYDVNYGFVPDTVSEDGEELDAYVLGVKEPLVEFEGKCIAVIHRTNDKDDKLVVIPTDIDDVVDEDILQQVHFQEQYFKSVIIRK